MAVIFIKGSDSTLVSQSLKATVDDLVGDGDRSLLVEEITEEDYQTDSGSSPAALVTAALTPPFLTDRRVVVGRNLGLFSKSVDVVPLIELLGAMPETTDLVLVWEAATSTKRLGVAPKPFVEALKSAQANFIDAAPSGRGRKTLLEQQLSQAPVRFDRGAKARIIDHFGDDIGPVASFIELLHSAFGPNKEVYAADIEPFLGQAADVVPWKLTDAIDNGEIAEALEMLDRMFVGGRRHPLQVMAVLQAHYHKALRLDGSGVMDERSAAEHLGITGSTFPAKKALAQTKRLGAAKIRRAIQMLAKADLDLRGGSALASETVVEVLVARLARLSRA